VEHSYNSFVTMKRLSLLLAALTFTAICFARAQRWPIAKKPAIALGKAETIGDKTIEEKYKGYFCIGAHFASLGDTEQEWELTYTSPKGDRKWVVIDGKGTAKLYEHMRDL
jgi:hypothetical protein